MTSIPTVTITVTGGGGSSSGASNTVEDRTGGLNMLYVQAIKGDMRKQWILFPPSHADLGASNDAAGQALLLNRTQEFAGNRSKWFRTTIAPSDPNNGLIKALSQHAEDGWTVGGHAVVPLEADDYKAAWDGETPHKAIRAIDRAIRPLGLQTK